MFCQKKQEKNAAGLVFFFFIPNQLHDVFFMGFINDFQMGAVDHFMHFNLLTTSYTLVNVFQSWETTKLHLVFLGIELGQCVLLRDKAWFTQLQMLMVLTL